MDVSLFVVAVLIAVWFRIHYQDPSLEVIAYFVPVLISVIAAIVSFRPVKHPLLITVVMMIFGAISIGAMYLNVRRLDDAHKQETDSHKRETRELYDKLEAIWRQSERTLENIRIRSQPLTDRETVGGVLIKKYILTHDNIPASVLSGSKLPPSEWMNAQLKALGQNWTIAPEENISPAILTPPLPKVTKISAKLSCGPENYRLPEKSNNPPLGPTNLTLAFGTREIKSLELARADYAECRFQLSNNGSSTLNKLELALETEERTMRFYEDSSVAFGFRKSSFRSYNGQGGMPYFPRVQIAANCKDGKTLPQPDDIANGISLKNDGEYNKLPFCLLKMPGILSMFVLNYTLRADEGNTATAIVPIKGSITFNVTFRPTDWGASRP